MPKKLYLVISFLNDRKSQKKKKEFERSQRKKTPYPQRNKNKKHIEVHL